MSAGNRKHPGRLAPAAPSRSSETGQLIAWSLMLGVLLTFLAAAYLRVLP